MYPWYIRTIKAPTANRMVSTWVTVQDCLDRYMIYRYVTIECSSWKIRQLFTLPPWVTWCVGGRAVRSNLPWSGSREICHTPSSHQQTNITQFLGRYPVHVDLSVHHWDIWMNARGVPPRPVPTGTSLVKVDRSSFRLPSCRRRMLHDMLLCNTLIIHNLR